MADGKNDARALRVLEIMNDYNSLQRHIAALCQRQPPDPASANLVGWRTLKQCQQQAQALLGKPFNPGSLGIPQDLRNVPNTNVAMAALQRIIFDASARRFQAHKIYLSAAAATRWCQLRTQLQQAGKLDPAASQRIDQRFAEEYQDANKDDTVYRQLRAADQRKSYWLNDDPSLDRLKAWIQAGL